ncbi:MAG: hypothetical protein ACT4P9_15610 [Betaproteobacteria bacterium]
MALQIAGHGPGSLAEYLERQLAHFFPDGRETLAGLKRHVDEALARLETCINGVRVWEPGRFDPLHTEQNTVFLYYLANTVWRRERDAALATRVYYLNKSLNAFNCYYEVELPEVFFVGHSLGIVLSRARYARHFAVYQNSTVGWNAGAGPEFEEGVVMFPNTFVLGRCRVRRGSILAQGTSLIDEDTEPGMIASRRDGALQFKAPRRDILGDIFRL